MQLEPNEWSVVGEKKQKPKKKRNWPKPINWSWVAAMSMANFIGIVIAQWGYIHPPPRLIKVSPYAIEFEANQLVNGDCFYVNGAVFLKLDRNRFKYLGTTTEITASNLPPRLWFPEWSAD